MLRRHARKVLDGCRRGTRHDEGYVRLARSLGEHEIGAGPEEAEPAGRRYSIGVRIGAAEQRGRLVTRCNIDQVLRHQPHLAEGPVVSCQAVLVLDAALDEIERDLWQAPLGQPPQVVVVEGLHRFLP